MAGTVITLERAVERVVAAYRGELSWANLRQEKIDLGDIRLPGILAVAAPSGVRLINDCKFRIYALSVSLVHNEDIACSQIPGSGSWPIARSARWSAAQDDFARILECLWDLLVASKSPYELIGDLAFLPINPDDGDSVPGANPHQWLGLESAGEIATPYKRGAQTTDFAPAAIDYSGM